jgi:hypothetical protein
MQINCASRKFKAKVRPHWSRNGFHCWASSLPPSLTLFFKKDRRGEYLYCNKLSKETVIYRADGTTRGLSRNKEAKKKRKVHKRREEV